VKHMILSQFLTPVQGLTIHNVDPRVRLDSESEVGKLLTYVSVSNYWGPAAQCRICGPMHSSNLSSLA